MGEPSRMLEVGSASNAWSCSSSASTTFASRRCSRATRCGSTRSVGGWSLFAAQSPESLYRLLRAPRAHLRCAQTPPADTPAETLADTCGLQPHDRVWCGLCVGFRMVD